MHLIEKDAIHIKNPKVTHVTQIKISRLSYSDNFLFLDCHMLGQFIKMQENDLLKAVKLFKVNCDEYGYAKSCLEYGNVAFTGVKEKNVKSGKQMLTIFWARH